MKVTVGEDKRDKFCLNFKGAEYCPRVNMRVPKAFCELVCRGNWEKYRKIPTDLARERARKPLAGKEKANREIVDVVIPVDIGDKDYILRTIDNLFATAIGPVNVLVGFDGFFMEIDDPRVVVKYWDKRVGQRKIANSLSELREGKYMFRLDAHCAMSEEWDARLKASCHDNQIAVCVFDKLKLDTWKAMGKDVSWVKLDKTFQNQFIRGWCEILDRKVEEEMMAMSGCAYMMTWDHFFEHGMMDESLGEYGSIGLEWSLKTWLTGGKIVLRTDAICVHHFRTSTPFTVDIKRKADGKERIGRMWFEGRGPNQIKPYQWLLVKFGKYLSCHDIPTDAPNTGTSSRLRKSKKDMTLPAPGAEVRSKK